MTGFPDRSQFEPTSWPPPPPRRRKRDRRRLAELHFVVEPREALQVRRDALAPIQRLALHAARPRAVARSEVAATRRARVVLPVRHVLRPCCRPAERPIRRHRHQRGTTHRHSKRQIVHRRRGRHIGRPGVRVPLRRRARHHPRTWLRPRRNRVRRRLDRRDGAARTPPETSTEPTARRRWEFFRRR